MLLAARCGVQTVCCRLCAAWKYELAFRFLNWKRQQPMTCLRRNGIQNFSIASHCASILNCSTRTTYIDVTKITVLVCYILVRVASSTALINGKVASLATLSLATNNRAGVFIEIMQRRIKLLPETSERYVLVCVIKTDNLRENQIFQLK